MPGTVHVSVLDFEGAQGTSISSKLPIKVSMGRREYLTYDKADFSFPVKTLRERITISAIDADGNEISSRGLEAKWIIEKGLCEEMISLEGGGIVHVKFCFLLSEEDRDRIRAVRQSALIRKRQELVNGNAGTAKSAENFTSVVQEVDFAKGHKISGLSPQDSEANQNSICMEASHQISNQVPKTNVKRKKGANFDSIPGREISVKVDDGRNAEIGNKDAAERTYDARDLDVNLLSTTYSVRKVDSELVLSLQGNKFVADEKKKQSEPQTSSSVKKMINVFESGLSNHARKLPHSELVPSNQSHLGEGGNVTKTAVGKIQNRLLSVVQKDKMTDLLDPDQCYNSSNSKFQNSDTLSVPRMTHLRKERRRSLLKNRSEADLEILSEKKRLMSSTNENGAFYSSVAMVEEGTHFDGLKKPCLQYSSNETGRSSCYGNRSSVTPWIFPDPTEKLCRTVSGKRVMELMQRNRSKIDMSHTVIPTDQEYVKEKSGYGTVVCEVSDRWKIAEKSTRPQLEKSEDTGKSRGPVGQVIRAAIMICFATLVILTRR